MGRSDDYGKLAEDREFDTFAHILGQAFGVEPERARRELGPNQANARVIRHQGRIVGGLVFVPVGQFYGGRRVSMTGVAGVGIAPWERGRGFGTALMYAAMRELRRSSTALSVLYPATYPLYRRTGYELAGGQYRIRVPTRAIGITDRTLTVRPWQNSDMAAVHRIYRSQAINRTGWLDRSPPLWARVRQQPQGLKVHGYVVLGDNAAAEAYVFFWQRPRPSDGYDIIVNDLMSATPQAGRRLLSFLADHQAQGHDVLWLGGTHDPLLYMLPERGYEVSLAQPWMLRIVDLKAALSERGYPHGVTSQLDLQVEDDIIGANQGRFVLGVADGNGSVRSGGRGSLRLHIRALAALYAGQATPHQLAAAGAIEGSATLLAKAATLFPSTSPSMPDFF